MKNSTLAQFMFALYLAGVGLFLLIAVERGEIPTILAGYQSVGDVEVLADHKSQTYTCEDDEEPAEPGYYEVMAQRRAQSLGYTSKHLCPLPQD